MQSKDLYARLELLNAEPTQAQPAPSQPRATVAVTPQWQRWGEALFRYFVGSKEPRIVVKPQRDGPALYEVYDPVDRRRHTFGSEHEVRVWLEERYYQ